VLWDNLHANDYDQRRLYLGPYAGRTTGLRAEVVGILLNPNCQFEANFIPIQTLGDYLRAATEEYSPRTAYLRAIGRWLPEFTPCTGEAITADDLEWLGDLLYLPTEFGERAEQFLADLSFLFAAPAENWQQRGDRVRTRCVQTASLYDKLTAVRNRELLHALYPHAWELKEVAQLLTAWIDWRQKEREPDAWFSSGEFRPRVFSSA
jgi:protein O-GlcNAcase/histone acetyltransferase